MKTLFLILLSATSAFGEIAPRWSRSGFLRDIESVQKAQTLISWRSDEESDSPLRLVWKTADGESKKIEVKTCEDYLAARDLHYWPQSNRDRLKEHRFRFRCESLRRIVEAKPSKESYLKDYVFHIASINELPPCVGGMGGVEGYRDSVDKAMGTLTSWKSFSPQKTVVRADKDELVFQDKDEAITAMFAVWGDFNGDGIEDVLALVATQPSGLNGSYKDFQAMALTRLKGERFFRALGEQGTWACLPQLAIKVGECRGDSLDLERQNFLAKLKTKGYLKALEHWSGFYERCLTTFGEERRLNFLADLSGAALSAKKWGMCESYANQGLQTSATEWTSTRTVLRSLAKNKDVCTAKIRMADPSKRLPTAEESDDGALQVSEPLDPWVTPQPVSDPLR